MNKRPILVIGLLLVLTLVTIVQPVLAADISSTFDNYRYIYTITPLAGEQIRSFHVYSGLGECQNYSYWDMSLPAGWFFNPETFDGRCVITFYTTGDPLPVGEPAVISYHHYCDPCCHSWFLSDEGTPAPVGNVIDDDEQHTSPCNIPAPWSDSCGGPGLLLAPKYPNAVDVEAQPWGTLKASYK